MKKHVKIFMEYWNISIADITPCFACEGEDGVINDVHHIENKKSGGDPQGLQDRIDNLIGLCRKCHDKAHFEKGYNEICKEKLNERILRKTYG